MADKQTLIDSVKKLGAGENVCASLEQLAEHDFDAPVEPAKRSPIRIEG